MKCKGLLLHSTALMLWVASYQTLAQEEPPNTTTAPVPTPINSTDSPTPNTNNTNTNVTSGSENVYEDWTDFVVGVNGWDFMGMWGKYDLLKLQEDVRPVPINPDDTDQSIFICLTSLVPSVLEKTYPQLRNVSLTFTYFITSPDQQINMTGEVLEVDGEDNRSEMLYNYTYPDDLMEHNFTWVLQTFELPNFTAEGDFKIRLKVGRGENGHWALSGIRVTGEMIPPPTTPAPTIPPLPPPVTTLQPVVTNTTIAVNTTEPSVNTTEAPDNSNTTTISANTTTPSTNETEVGTNVTTLVPPVPEVTTEEPTEVPKPEGQKEEVKQLQGVAQAIWDAFYVFLALFCACIVALIVLIARSRWCKSSEPPPTVATYNPRTSSYRLDKVYDNPALDTNSV